MNVVYPLIPGWKHEDFEFRHSLRSLEKNLGCDFDVTVIGRYLPLWVKPGSIRFIPTETGRSKEALRRACDEFSEFMWMNDDIYINRPCTWEDRHVRLWHQDLNQLPETKAVWDAFKEIYPKNPQAGAALMRNHGMTKWMRRIWTTYDILAQNGSPALNFSIHAPYIFESSKLLELSHKFDGIFTSEHVVETAYFNTYNYEDRNKRYTPNDWQGAYNKEQADAVRIDQPLFLNHNDDGLTDGDDGLKRKIRLRFPNKSRFEK